MILKIWQVLSAKISSETPLSYNEAKGVPGVYRLENLSNESAALVVTTDNRKLYVNEGFVKLFEEMNFFKDLTEFWPTELEVPDNLVFDDSVEVAQTESLAR